MRMTRDASGALPIANEPLLVRLDRPLAPWHNAVQLDLHDQLIVNAGTTLQAFSVHGLPFWLLGEFGYTRYVGSGTAVQGKQIFADNCAACHGDNGQGGIKDRLAGGQGTLASSMPVKTVGSFWPYATTLFDYIHRAMPYPTPGSLSTDETYAVTAYILSLNGIVPADGRLDKESLPKIRMPNRDGFVPQPEFDPAKLFRRK